MFPGRRLTRWCQLVPRILMIKNGRAMIATTSTQQSNNNSNTDLITTTHSMDLVPTLENKDTLIILCDNDASSSGDLGLIFLRVPLKAAGEEKMIFDVKTKKIHEEIKAGTRVLATKKEANERTKEMTDAVRNTLLFTVQNRTILERGTDCSCLVFELSGKDRKSGIFARDKLLSIIREQVYEQVCRSLDETAMRMTNEMKAKNFVSDAVTFNQQKKDELFERMFHVLYSETAILDFISQSSSFTEILKSKLLPSSIISPILGTILAKSKNNNSKEQQEEKKRKEEMLLPKMSVPRDKLMKQLSDSVDYVKEEMKKRKQEKLLELQRLKNEQQQQQQQSKLSSGMMRREDGDTSSLRVKAAAKELYNDDDFSFSSSDSDDNSTFGGSKDAIEMVVNGRKRLLGAHGGIRKERMIKKYAIEKLKKNLSERASSSPTTTKNQQQQSSFSLLESRERMLMLMRNVEQKKLERKREQQQLERDLQLMSKVDELLARTEAYDDILDHIIDDDDDDDYTKNQNGNNENEFNEQEQAELEMMIREYDYHDLVVGASPSSSPNVQQQYQEQRGISSPIHGGKGKKKTLLTSTDYDNNNNEHIKMTMKASEDEDIQKCRLQQRMLNLLIIKICSQQVSQQNAREIGEAERRLL